MDSFCLYEYADLLERVFAVAYTIKYSTGALERSISYSPFFQKLEKSDGGERPIIDEESLITSLLGGLEIDLEAIPVYAQCLWAAEAYLRIQMETQLTFEAIFLYIPIARMYNYFPIYHEMDFSQIISVFKGLFSKRSVLDVLLEKRGLSLSWLSEQTQISYDTLYSAKSRRRDPAKLSLSAAIKIAKACHVRPETIGEIQN